MIPLCDLHTHTTFCDGKNTPEEMIVSALQKGLYTLGFSGHVPAMVKGGDTDWWIPPVRLGEYCKEVLSLKNKYAGQIEVLLGFEMDYFSPELKGFTYEYLIGSVHYVKTPYEYIPVDASPDILKESVARSYGGDFMAYAKDYFETEAHVVEKTNCDIVGHFDLLTKFNEKYPCIDENDKKYQTMALEALDSILEKDVLIEINTGAISRGWRTLPYPSEFILKHIAQKQGRVILNSDAHSADNILFAFDNALSLARSCGIKDIWTYKNGGFSPIRI